MNLNIEQRYRVIFGDSNAFRILLVGVGGTGSALALALGGLMVHARQKGIHIDLTLVDDDRIEAKNIGRQAFAPASSAHGGVHKCADLALRLNAAYGLDITAWPERYIADMGARWMGYGHTDSHLIIGCVDNYHGRREIAKTVAAYAGQLWAIDSGNAAFNGQILVGNTTSREHIQLDKLGLCTALPSPYLQEPSLLLPEEKEQPLSCAELTLREEQSLMVNRMAATIVAQYVYNMSIRRQLTQLATVFNLEPTVMTPTFITETTIAAYFPPAEAATTMEDEHE
jgi:PRTRC genetic system ThiF family protein